MITKLKPHALFANPGRTWPIALSTGFGAGAAYADCDRSFNPARIAGVRVVSEVPK